MNKQTQKRAEADFLKQEKLDQQEFERKEQATILDRASAAMELTERVRATMQVGYKSACAINCPTQLILLDLMEQASAIHARLNSLVPILEGRAAAK